MPQRYLQYLQDVICSIDFNNEGNQVQIDKHIGRFDLFNSNSPLYCCLLSNRNIRNIRDRLLRTLIEMKLVVKASNYNSGKNGGNLGDCYVPAPKLKLFIGEFSKFGLSGYLWPEELEEMHNVFHILIGPNSLQNWEELDIKIPVRFRESAKDFINECLNKKMLTESNRYIAINDPILYNSELVKRYQKPLIDFLEGENTTPKTSVIITPQQSIDEYQYDAFISHASEDKERFVKELAKELEKEFNIWYDELSLTPGDSQRESIDKGLLKSRFGIVILSHNFFSREWTRKELDGLLTRQMQGKITILPVWLDVTSDDVVQFSPMLAGLHAIKVKDGMDKVVSDLSKVLKTKPKK